MTVDAPADVRDLPSLPLLEEVTARSWVQHYPRQSLDVVEAMLCDEMVTAELVLVLLVVVALRPVCLCDAS